MEAKGHEAEFENATIVLVGNFNPSIFHPAWFASQELITEGESAAATKKECVCTPAISVFRFERITVDVRQDRFLADAGDPRDFERLQDLVIGTFTLLKHCPISAVGINLNSHFQYPSKDKLDEFGFSLVPRTRWLAAGLKTEMMNVHVRAPRPDAYAGFIHVRVQPSSRIKIGACVQVNDHYTADGDFSPERVLEILGIASKTVLPRARKLTQDLVMGAK